MKLDFAAHTFGLSWTHSATEAIETLARHDFRFFELLVMPPHVSSTKLAGAEAEAIRKAVASVQGKILALDLPSNDINLGSPLLETVEFTRGLYLNLLESAARVEARSIIVLPGRQHGLLPPPDARLSEIVIEEIGLLSDRAAELGLEVLIENHPLTLARTANEIMNVLESVGRDNTGVAYDLTNAQMIGVDQPSEIRELSDRIRLVHLSDCPMGAWSHDRIGTGVIDFSSAFDALMDISYSGCGVLEVISHSPVEDILSSRTELQRYKWQARDFGEK